MLWWVHLLFEQHWPFVKAFLLMFRWCNISQQILRLNSWEFPCSLVFAFRFPSSHTMDLGYLLAWFRFVRIKRLEYCNVSYEIDFVIGFYLRKCVCNWNDIIIPYFIHCWLLLLLLLNRQISNISKMRPIFSTDCVLSHCHRPVKSWGRSRRKFEMAQISLLLILALANSNEPPYFLWIWMWISRMVVVTRRSVEVIKDSARTYVSHCIGYTVTVYLKWHQSEIGCVLPIESLSFFYSI